MWDLREVSAPARIEVRVFLRLGRYMCVCVSAPIYRTVRDPRPRDFVRQTRVTSTADCGIHYDSAWQEESTGHRR